MSHDDGDSDGVEQSPEGLLREAQRRLTYYENFGAALQQQMDAVVAHAAAAAREAEAEQAEIRLENERLRLEVEGRRQESHELGDDVARLRGEVADLERNAREEAEQLEEWRQERDRLGVEIAELGRESQALVADLQRRRAAEDAHSRRVADEIAQILATFKKNAEGSVVEAIAGLNNLGVEATPQDLGMEAGAWSPVQAAEPNAWDADTSQDKALETEAWARSLSEGWAAENADEPSAASPADDRAIEGDFPPEPTPTHTDAAPAEAAGKPEFYLGRPLFVPPPPRPSLADLSAVGETSPPPTSPPPTGAELDDAEGTVTRLLVRPPFDPVKLGELRGALEDLPGVMAAQPLSPDEPVGPLLITHAPEISLLGSLLAIPGLDFRLVSRGDDFIEIELLEVSSPPR